MNDVMRIKSSNEDTEVKKKLLTGAVVGSAGLIALTGAALAQSDEDTPGSSIRDRVAEILGISSDELQDAVQQAREEFRDEQLAERLAQAVEDGTITQEESDAIASWYDAKPEVLDEIAGAGKGFGFCMQLAGNEERLEARLTELVEDGTITEAGAQEVRDWVAAAPVDALEKLPGAGSYYGMGHGGFHGRIFGRGPGGGLFQGRFQIVPYESSSDSGDEVSTSSATSVGDVA